MVSAAITLDGREIGLSNTDKVLFPSAGLTKEDLIDYYRRIAPIMLPHLDGRALSFERYPDGIDAEGFFQKNASGYFPDWIRTVELAKEDGVVAHVVADTAATLAYLANQACITLHVSLSRTDRPNHPDRLVIDLDPSDGDFVKVKRAARDTKHLLDDLDLPAYLQTTGSRGLHVWVPLDRSGDYERVRAFTRKVADLLVERHPDQLTTEQRKRDRGDRIFLDVARNAYGQTAVAPYSVRARSQASIATPIGWEELSDSRLAPDRYTIGNIFRRLGRRRDPWADMAKDVRALGNAERRVEALRR